MIAPHEPVVSEGGRRCETCRLLPEEHPAILYRAVLESSYFSFEAYGEDEAEARRAMTALILEHTQTHGADPEWASDAIDDTTVYPVAAGYGYRDGDTITTPEG